MQPGEGAFDLPAVSAKPFLGFEPWPSDARSDVPSSTGGAVFRRAVRLVCMQLVGTPTRSAPRTRDGLHRVEHLFQHLSVVDIGGGQLDGKGQTVAIGQQVMLAAGASAVARVGSAIRAPLFAGTSDASSAARFQLMRPA